MSDKWIQADWPAPEGITAGTTLRDSDFELPARPHWINQVHGTRVVRAGSSAFAGGRPDADAIIAGRRGDICVVKTADCVPILLCSRDGRQFGAIHGGWRGMAAGVIETTVAEIGAAATELMAWLGPAISQAAFEVGDEVRHAYLAVDAAAEAAFEQNDNGRWQADLYLLARQRLGRAGVGEVYGGGLCTYADRERFYSFRRDGETGRMLSFVYRGPR